MKKLIYAVLIAIFAMLVVESCQQEEQTTVDKRFVSEFLSINHEISIDNLTKAEKKTLYKAFLRVATILDEDGCISFIHMSGKELNMSENVYQFFKMSVENTIFNKSVTRSSFNIEDSLGGDGGFQRDNDCVIYTIVAIMSDMHVTGYTIENIREKLSVNGYYTKENGTSYVSLNSALQLFFDLDEVTYDENFDLNWSEKDHYMIITKTEDPNTYHAGTVLAATKGNVWYRDDQGNALNSDTLSTGVASKDEVVRIFKLVKK